MRSVQQKETGFSMTQHPPPLEGATAILRVYQFSMCCPQLPATDLYMVGNPGKGPVARFCLNVQFNRKLPE